MSNQQELFQLLLECKLNGRNEDNFEKRFQSFLDQIPQPGGSASAVSKPSFFPGFFLGMFATLKSIEAASNYKIENLHFKIDEVGDQYTLHLALTKKEPLVFVFSLDPNKSLDYYKIEYRDLLKNIDSLQVINISRIKQTIDRKEYSKLLVSTGKEENSRVLRGFEQKLRSKGFIQIPRNVSVVLDQIIRNTTEQSRQKGALTQLFDFYIELYGNLYNNLHQSYPNQSDLIPLLFDQEAFQHAFVSGGLINFRYSENVKVHLEQIIGKGYADIVLLVRGSERSMISTPIIIELKKNQPNKDNALNALKEVEWYARGWNTNNMRFLTSAKSAIGVGLDLKGKDYRISSTPIAITPPAEPFLTSLFKGLHAISYKGDRENEFKDLLGKVYYQFPNTESSLNYLSRFSLGQAFSIGSTLELGRTHILAKYAFVHTYRKNLSTLISLTASQAQPGSEPLYKLSIVNIDESGQQMPRISLTREQINQIIQCIDNAATSRHIRSPSDKTQVALGGIEIAAILSRCTFHGLQGTSTLEMSNSRNRTIEVSELNVISHTKQASASPATFYRDSVKLETLYYKSINDYLRDPIAHGNRDATGHLYPIVSSPQAIQNAFNKAVDYQHDLSDQGLDKRITNSNKIIRQPELSKGGVVAADSGPYNDFLNQISQIFFNNKKYLSKVIEQEHEFKAILHGLSTAASATRYNKFGDRLNAVVATEFQVGGGGRADIMIQTININDEDSRELRDGIPILLELKLDRSHNSLVGSSIPGRSQLYSYLTSPNIKAITDKENVAGIIVILGLKAMKRATTKEDIFMTSGNFSAASVAHSSVPGQERRKRSVVEDQVKRMTRAIEDDDVKTIQSLLDQGTPANMVVDDNGRTFLHYAAEKKSLEAIKLIAEKISDVNVKDKFGTAAIHVAASVDAVDIIQFLVIEKDVKVNVEVDNGSFLSHLIHPFIHGHTPLHCAAKNGHIRAARSLVNLGANLNARDSKGKTPSDLESDYLQAKGIPIAHPLIDPSVGGAVIIAISGIAIGIMTKDYNTVGKKVIHFAAEDNDVGALKYRINQGDDINLADNNWWRPLHYASASGSSDSTKLLLDNGAGFYSYTYKTSTCKAPIHIAAENGYTDIVKTFLDRGVDIDWRDSYDRCGGEWLAPLHYAAKGGYPDTVRSLINRGANIERLTFYWKTPIFYAAEKGHVDVVSELVRRGANVDAREKSNFLRPIHYAIKNGYLNVVKLLVESKADITLGEAYDSPLHWAIIHNQFNIIKYLSEQLKQRGIEPSSIKDYYGKTALDLAREKGHTNIVSHLESLNRRSIESSQRDKRSVEGNKKSSTEELSYLKLDNEKSVMRKAVDNKSTIHNNTLETENFDFNGALLLSTLLSKLPIVGKFFPKIKLPDTNSTTFTSISLPESMAYAADITQEFEKILNKTATHLSISKESLNLNPVLLSSEIAQLFRNASKTSELSKVLYSYAKEISRDNNEFLNLIKAELPNLEKTYELKFNNLQANITSLSINNIVPNNITTSSEKEIKYLPSSSMSNINMLAVANNSMTR